MSLRIVVTTTLNDNLFHAKLLPLARSRPDTEVVVVTDRRGPPFERVVWLYPRGWLKVFGRLGGRILLLLREVLVRRPCVVMAYNVLPHGFFAVLAGGLRGLPVYLHFISGAAETSFAHNPVLSGNRMVRRSRNPRRLERIARWTARRADKIFVPGSSTERHLLSAGYPASKIVRLHSTIDLNRFSPGSETRDVDVLVSAQLTERKRPLFTLDVFRRILDGRPTTRFCWLGDGPLKREFDAAVDRLGLRESLVWAETSDVARYYRRARVFLLCSVREGLSLACMEAMACGMVPVTSDSGDMSDVVRRGETGQLLPLDATPHDFASAALAYLENPERWAARSAASRELIEREHSFDSAIRAWRDLLEPLARRRG